MDAAAAVSQLFTGLSMASILLMMALGLAVIFGLMGVINMAHGELMTMGAYVAYLCQLLFAHFVPGQTGWSYLLALPLSFVVSGLLGWAIEVALVRHLYGRPLETLLATWGLSLILQQSFRTIFGSNNVFVSTPEILTGGVALGASVQLPYVRLFILGLAALSLGGVFLFLYRTRNGLMIRSVMQNRPMAASCGINTRRIDALTFAFGSGLAGLAGCALSLIGSVGPTTGQNYIVDSFMVVVLGGVGQLLGTVVGALTIGEAHALIEYFTSSSAAKVAVFTMIILFLQARPAGLFPSVGRVLD
ncbi:high-affinity branched-chain amino acid transport system permease protein LivH [bacterium BMS3Bbin12]|nr:high-affinity branched-chain amino acid transport system permease protein LivH [bacterium BMS3Abin12]GBE47813.1 high-affinity branched-chain amino acid transport system permease protein LivH [bacterium BMS3Bbin12]GBE51060.1 high-affinity branched-chain amino acid transport system permease protein LivH [bacterium BMS3Bbin13]HDJ86097.1 urea ABC transporter permease subunit UrtB [Chromatiales bacterium]HDK02362.1 urea ABC transporter permease subunit UrtB [Gammaproteobacteria bacterium]